MVPNLSWSRVYQSGVRIFIALLFVLLSLTTTLPVNKSWTSNPISFDWDLEGKALEVLTNASDGSGDSIVLSLETLTTDPLLLSVRFSNPMQYKIGNCQDDFENFTTNPPDSQNDSNLRVWRFGKRHHDKGS